MILLRFLIPQSKAQYQRAADKLHQRHGLAQQKYGNYYGNQGVYIA